MTQPPPTRQVFISHSAADREAAEAIRAALEAAGLACWIAPRDIPAGTPWAAAIMAGIAEVRAVLLIHSAASAASAMVLREVNAAIDAKTPVIPVRIDPTPVQDSMQFYLGSTHWLDAAAGALPAHLARIVAAVAATLGQAAAPAPPALALPEKPSIAVLAFQNMSGDPEQEYFADGVVEDIITALSRTGWLFVIARNSSFAYKGKSPDIRTVGRELGVRYVLEGSVRKSGGRVRINCQLIEAATGSHIWADRFEGDLADIFDVQDRITESVVGAIEPSLKRAEIARATAKPTERLDAYDLYLRALQHYYVLTVASVDQAVTLLRQALAIDSGYMRAAALLATVQVWRKEFRTDDPRGQAEAITLARQSIAMASDDPEALRFAGYALSYLAGDFPTAIAAFNRAKQLHPNSAAIWTSLGTVYLHANNPAPARDCYERAMRLSPLDPELAHMIGGLGCCHLMVGETIEAVPLLRRAIQEMPQITWPYRFLIQALVRLDQRDEAHKVAARLIEIKPNSRVDAGYNNHLFNPEFNTERWQALLQVGLPG